MTSENSKPHRGHAMTRRELLAAGAALVSAGVAGPAFSQTEETALMAAAKKEGRGMFYTTAPLAEAQRVTLPFKEKYGIEIEVLRLTSGELQQRFAAEVETNNVISDAFYTSDFLFVKNGIEKGWFAKVGDLPAAKGWPSVAWNGSSALVSRTPYSIAWNTDLVPQGITSWEQMLDPRWKGRVGAGDPRVLASPNLWYSLMRKTYGDDFLRKLGAQATFMPSTVPGLQQVAAGVLAMYAPASHNTVVDLQAKGAPLKEGFLSPTVASDNWLSVVAKAPHPNVARLFLNFYMTPEMQAAANKGAFSILPNIPGTLPMPSVTETDPTQVNVEKPQLLSLLGLS